LCATSMRAPLPSSSTRMRADGIAFRGSELRHRSPRSGCRSIRSCTRLTQAAPPREQPPTAVPKCGISLEPPFARYLRKTGIAGAQVQRSSRGAVAVDQRRPLRRATRRAGGWVLLKTSWRLDAGGGADVESRKHLRPGPGIPAGDSCGAFGEARPRHHPGTMLTRMVVSSVVRGGARRAGDGTGMGTTGR